MIRLPATGIDISQNDLNSHLQQLDIYKGLLQQGFRKAEVQEYFKNRAEKEQQDALPSENFSLPPSTLELCTLYKPLEPSSIIPDDIDLSPPSDGDDHVNVSPEACSTDAFLALPKPRQSKKADEQPYMPRQSSHLRFVRDISPADKLTPPKRMPRSPRDNITYQKVKHTHSYGGSAIGENAVDLAPESVSVVLEHLSLDQELVPASAASTRTTIRVVSNLRAEADSFTPLHLRQDSESADWKGKARAQEYPDSDDGSIRSSPPLFPSRGTKTRSPSLPRLPRTPATRRGQHQQYLDGSFTVYDDTVPARFQPQTTADLSRDLRFDNSHAAYTAPPGMIRSPAPLYSNRHPSGDQSPTARAQLMRERRQREFVRGAQIEGLRVRRAQDTSHDDPQTAVAMQNFWRDDLDADGVGEENNDPLLTLELAFRRLRTVSGNRRAA